MGCFSRIAQILLFVFNFIFVVAGLALLVVGVLVKLNLDDIVPENYSSAAEVAPILLIIVGCIIFFIAFLGCYGAMKESKCMLILYIVIIVCILIVQIVAGVYALTAIKKGDEAFRTEMKKVYQEIFEQYSSNKVIREYIDRVQQSCCGVTTPSDWGFFKPESCYEGNDRTQEIFKEGCVGFIVDAIEDLSDMIGKVALGLCVTEVLTIIFAFCIIC